MFKLVTLFLLAPCHATRTDIIPLRICAEPSKCESSRGEDKGLEVFQPGSCTWGDLFTVNINYTQRVLSSARRPIVCAVLFVVPFEFGPCGLFSGISGAFESAFGRSRAARIAVFACSASVTLPCIAAAWLLKSARRSRASAGASREECSDVPRRLWLALSDATCTGCCIPALVPV